MSVSTLPPRGSKPIDEKKEFTQIWWGWFSKISVLFVSGFSGTVVTAKLTAGGTNGSITFQNGVVISQTPAT